MSLRDETEENPLGLLAQYRQLCEAAGAAAASGSPMPRASLERLRRVEAELQSRLWLASAERRGGNGPVAPERTKPPSRHSVESSDAANVTSRQAAGDEARRSRSPSSEEGRSAPSGAVVYSDGACLGNPGPGGYCAIVRVPGQPDRTVSGGKARTTNNEMEMTAALEGLRQAIAMGGREISVVSDSEYLVKGMTSWIRNWLRNGWKTSAGQPVKNRLLWEELHELTRGREVTWTWTRGHAGHAENERCDALAVAAAKQAAAAGRQ
jgi:ribonuclease HI